MTYLVTGGAGLLGAYTTRELVRSGERVVCYDIAPATKLLAALLSPQELAQVAVVRGDVAEWPQLLQALSEHGAGTIVHLASPLRAGANADPPSALRAMCEGTSNVFEAAALHGIGKVVWTSSVDVFGPRSHSPEGVIANDAPLDPLDIYGGCKAFGERIAPAYAERYGLDIVGLRHSLIYGYGRVSAPGSGTAATYLHELIDKPALGRGPCVVPFGDQAMNWVHAEDAAHAVVLACRAANLRTRAFNIGGFRHTFAEAFAIVRELAPGVAMTLQPGLRAGSHGPMDIAAAGDELGYVPAISLREGLQRTFAMLRREAGLPAA